MLTTGIRRSSSVFGAIALLLFLLGLSNTAIGKQVVRINDYVIDVSGREPAVPPELEPVDVQLEKSRNIPPGSARKPASEQEGMVVVPAPPGRAALPEERKYKKWIVQFTGPVHNDQKQKLADLGCRIGDYLPDFAFLVTMDNSTKKQVDKLPFVTGAVRYKPAYKIHNRLKDASGAVRVENGRKVKLNIRVDDAQNRTLVLSEALRAKGKILDVSGDVIRVEIAREHIPRLSQIEEVIWIEEAVPLKLLNDTSKWVIQTNVPDDTKIWDKGLHGEGQLVGIGDTGLDYDMPWFHDPAGAPVGPSHRKIAGYDPTYGDDYDGDFGHGTHVAGTVGGDQTPVNGQSAANGMAPKARFFIQDITAGESHYVYPPSDLGLMFITPYNAGARLHTNSWGAAVTQYETMARSADRFMWDHKDFLALFANGNSGPGSSCSGSVGTPANAKNIVSVGATENGAGAENVAYFSTNGPTNDGRIKPTVTAPGVSIISANSDGIKNSFNSGTVAYSGTSMATPAATGAAALVRQYFLDGYWPSGTANPGDSIEPSAALVKATLLNSARNMTGSYTDAPIPSTGQGWGRINLSHALHFGGDAGTLEIVDEHTGLNTAGTWSTTFYAPADGPFKVSLAWTDFPGIEGAATAIVNDLDLTVTASDGTVYYGNVFADGASITGGSRDRLNVEEQVLIQNPVKGTYTVSVSAYNVPFGPQPFALVLTGASSVTSKGFITLNKQYYNGSGSILVTLGDRDLNVAGNAADEVSVTISSTTEPGGETLQLIETGPDTAVFTGSLPIGIGSAVPGNGILEGVDGDAITANYQDADDGTGLPAVATAGATIDLMPPAISSVVAANIGETSASIAWATDEPSDSAINYGETTDRGIVLSDTRLVTQHAMLSIAGLQEATTYYYDVSSRDEAGNSATDDNGGNFFTFTTQSLPPNLTVYSSEGSQTYYDTTTIYGIAVDPSGVTSVTVNGTPAEYRSSDGYYELSVALNYGTNTFTVVATDALGNSGNMTITITQLHPSDLVMTAVSGSTQADAGQIIEVANTVSNIGEGDAGRFMVGIYLSTDSAVTKDDIPIGGWKVMSLAAGASQAAATMSIIPASLEPGTYYIGAIADDYEFYDQYESDETNNSLTGNQIQIVIGDLAMTEVSGVPAQGLTGQTISVTNTATNTSSGATTPAFSVSFYFSEDAVITADDMFLGSRTVSSIAPGASDTDSTAIVLPATIPSGTYYIGAIVDVHNFVRETDETNNVLAAQNAISITGPDIIMESVSGPTNARSGDVIEVSNTVTASATGGSAPDFYVALYLSTDSVITTSDIFIGLRWLPGLGPGAASTDPTGVMIPATVPPGIYYLGAVADNVRIQEGLEDWAYQEDNARETDETNNTVAGNEITILGPDLVVAGVNGPLSGPTGGSIIVSNTIVAGFSGGAAPQSIAAFYLSTDAAITKSDRYLGSRTVPDLISGGSSAAETVLTVPAGMAPGTYYIGVIADYNNAVTESDETNNALAGNQVMIAGPDLVMTALSGPASALSGVPLVVSNTVSAAAAGGGAPNFSVGIYLSEDNEITTSDRLIGYRLLPGLAYGDTSTDATTVTVPNSIAPGTYYFGAIADYGNATLDSDRTNNALAGNQVAVTGPDLVITEISGPASGLTGGPMTVNNTVAADANGGGVSSGGFNVGIYLSAGTTTTTSDILIGIRHIGPLAPGESSTAETSVTIPASIAAGTYYLGAIADHGNSIVESDETNNSLAGNQITITGPDLTMTSVSGPAAGSKGQTITVNTAVSASPAGGSAPLFYVGIFLSTDPVITDSDILLGSRLIGGLAPGGNSTADTVVTIPANLATGIYYIGAIADNFWIPCFECDPTGYLAVESDETNNAITGNTISIIPDLTMTAVSGPASGLTGGSITVANTAAATGSGVSGFSVGIYLSTDSVITTQDRLLTTRWVSNLAAGASSAADTTVTVPLDLAAGTYYFGVIADPYNTVQESDETNNTLAGEQITITGPDLSMTAVSGPASGQAGGTITVSSTVIADANGGAPPNFNVGFYLSSDAVITTSDRYIGNRFVFGLAPGASSTADTVITIPASVPGGTYYIGAIADHNNGVQESDEANNDLAGNQLELAGPDLTMTAVSGPATSVRGATVTVDSTVTNIGGLDSSHFYVGIYLSTDSMITESDMLLGYRYVSGLASGASSAAASGVAIPFFIPPGTYYIGAIADNFIIEECDEWDCWDTGLSNRIIESNEGNNALTGNQIEVTLP